MPSLKVAYILLYFPQLTETFIADEMHEIRSHDVDVRIISLLSPKAGPVQPLSQRLAHDTWYAPGLLRGVLWRAQFHFLLTSWRLYLRLLATMLSQPYPRRPASLFVKRLVVFLKAVSVAHYLRDCKVDLFHAHFAWLPGAAAWICARLLNKPFTVTVHAYDIYSYRNDLLRLISREATNVVAISEFNKSQLAALGSGRAHAISVIHCGVKLSSVAEQAARRPAPPIGRPSADGPLRILSVGTLVPKKGHRILIAACHLLNERGFNFTCTIIGGGLDERALREQIRVSGLQHRVALLGARAHPAIVEAYHEHDLFVLASVVASDGDRDGIPVVLMEAATRALPIISTPVSGIPELVQHEETGWLVPPGDATALADAIVILGTDSGMRTRLARNARALIQSKFGIERSARQLADLFQKTHVYWEHGTSGG